MARGSDGAAAACVADVYRALRFATRDGMTVAALSAATGLTVHHVNKILRRNPHRFERSGKRGKSPVWRRRERSCV